MPGVNIPFYGEGGIRTLGRLASTPVFETGPFGRSGTSPARPHLLELPVFSRVSSLSVLSRFNPSKSTEADGTSFLEPSGWLVLQAEGLDPRLVGEIFQKPPVAQARSFGQPAPVQRGKPCIFLGGQQSWQVNNPGLEFRCGPLAPAPNPAPSSVAGPSGAER